MSATFILSLQGNVGVFLRDNLAIDIPYKYRTYPVLMAVYTEITTTEAQDLLHRLDLGNVRSLEGCAGGIENTNYFVTTDKNDYVLTVFERLSFEQLPYYLHLMQHLAKQGIPVPDPAPDATGALLHSLHGKPASVVNKLLGKSELVPQIILFLLFF